MTLTSALFPWIFHARTTRSLQYLFSLFFFYFSPFFSNSLLNLWLFLFISHFLLFLFLFPSSIVSSHFRLLSVYRRPRFFPGKIDRFSDLSFDSLSLFKNLFLTFFRISYYFSFLSIFFCPSLSPFTFRPTACVRLLCIHSLSHTGSRADREMLK